MHITYLASFLPGELNCEANYYLWLPPGVKKVRGIILHQHGCGDGAAKGNISAVSDLHWQALARKWDCALLGTAYLGVDQECSIWSDPSRGSRARFHQALRDFAAQTGHNELENAPLAIWGHSGGGSWCQSMATLEPERIVGAWLRSGVLGLGKRAPGEALPPIPDAALRVPMMINPGEQEKGDICFAPLYDTCFAAFHRWREKGALIGFVMTRGALHNCGTSRYLALPWLDTCLAARLPYKIGGPLQPMPTAPAWLAPLVETTGESSNGRPQPAANFTGDVKAAVWLPNEKIAHAWTEFLRTGRVTDPTPPPAPFDVKAAAEATGTLLTWNAVADFESGLHGFVIERDGKVIDVLASAKEDPKSVFQGLSYHDTPTQPPVVEMTFTDLFPVSPSGLPRYRIRAVNTAGLVSPWSAAK